jgi:hypothetical protein
VVDASAAIATSPTIGGTSDLAASSIECRAPITPDVQIQVFCQGLGLSPCNVSLRIAQWNSLRATD